jgi:hypothetical protein
VCITGKHRRGIAPRLPVPPGRQAGLHERPVDKHTAEPLEPAATDYGRISVTAEVNEPPVDRDFVVRDSHRQHPVANLRAEAALRARLRRPESSREYRIPKHRDDRLE